jgi:hypothetical protein
MCSPATRLTRSGVLLAVLVAGQPAAAQTLPPSDASVQSTASNARVVVHVYVEPSFNRMAEWHARIDALQADALARHLPVSDDVTNVFVAWGGTLLVRLTPRILVGGELGKVQDQDRFAVTELIGGIFQGSVEFGVGVETILARNPPVIAGSCHGSLTSLTFSRNARIDRENGKAGEKNAAITERASALRAAEDVADTTQGVIKE